MQRALLIVLVVASYLLLAGGPRWTLGPLLLVAGLAVLAAPRRTLKFPRPWRALDISLLALVVALVIQQTPLPSQLVARLTPNAELVRQALSFSALTDATPAWRPLSIDPDATRYALAAVVLGVLSFWIARALFSAGGHTRRFCRALIFFGAAAAMVALVQKALAPALLLGFIPAATRSANPLGPFVNRNHFATWLLMVAAVACGYLIAHLRIHGERHQTWRRSLRQFLSSESVPIAASAAIVIGVIFATLSRSAVAGLSAAALAGGLMGRPRMQVERTSLPTVLGIAGTALLAAVLFLDIDGWATRLGQSIGADLGPFSRISIWRETVPMIRDFLWTGSGAGTFSDAMTQYQQSRVWVGSMQRWAHFNNAHSHYLQLLSEGGLLLAVPAMSSVVLLVTLGRRALRADKGEMFWVRVGAAAGLIGVAVQSIWEVGLAMPANAVLCGVLAGLVLYRRDGGSESSATNALPASSQRRARVA